MQDNLEMFLLVAEELSFTKAAKRAFVTQQTASYHIQSLELEYGVKLFNRKPTLTLTRAGKVLYKNLINIKAMEISIDEQISEIKGESIGELKVGINTVRARIMLPELLPIYIEDFPKVKTTFLIYDTYLLSEMLLNKEINMFIGVETKSNPAFNRKKLMDENIYFLTTSKFLKKHKNLTNCEIKKLHKRGVNLVELNNIPTIRNLDGCSFNTIIDNNIAKYDINLPELINTSDYDIQIDLCANSIAAAFCPTMILYRVIEYNQLNKNSDKEILIFKINDIEEKLRVDTVTSAIIPNPKYLNTFIDELHKKAGIKYSQLNNWLYSYFDKINLEKYC